MIVRRHCSRLRRAMGWFWRQCDGSATLEFAIVVPVVLSLLIMGGDAGYTSLQRVALDRAVDVAVRDVRLGSLPQGMTHDAFRTHVCGQAIMLPGCEERLLIEMRVIQTSNFALPDGDAPCINMEEEIAPVTQFSLGAGDTVMYLRACYLMRPIFPTTSLGLQLPLDSSGMFALRTLTGFVNE